uniref:Uncharacterized protein n=1 Tax=Pavo cristatus TaxID=9049 RepID=A0A8C9FSM4_PAVCR
LFTLHTIPHISSYEGCILSFSKPFKMSFAASVVLEKLFREEFKAAFSCCIFGIHSHHDERLTRGRASTESRKSLTTQISNFDNVSKHSEHVVLTNINTLTANGNLQNI